MPRKMAGRLMMTMELSSDAMNTPRVVFESAVHLYRELIFLDCVADGDINTVDYSITDIMQIAYFFEFPASASR